MTPESTTLSIAPTSPVSRERMSPRRRRSKKLTDRVCRCANTLVRIRCRKFSPIQAPRYWPAKPSTPTSRVMPTNAAATGRNAPKSRGINTRSTNTWNNEIAPASASGVTITNTRLSHIHRQNGRASGQNRRNTSRTPAAGANSTKRPAPSCDAGRSNDLTTPHIATPLYSSWSAGQVSLWAVTPTLMNRVSATAHRVSSN